MVQIMKSKRSIKDRSKKRRDKCTFPKFLKMQPRLERCDITDITQQERTQSCAVTLLR